MNFVIWCCLFEVSHFYFTFCNVWISILSIIENTLCPAIIFWTLCHQVHQGNMRLQKHLEVKLLHQQYVCTWMKFQLKRAWAAGSVCKSNAVLMWCRSILWMCCWHVSIHSFCITYRLKVQRSVTLPVLFFWNQKWPNLDVLIGSDGGRDKFSSHECYSVALEAKKAWPPGIENTSVHPH